MRDKSILWIGAGCFVASGIPFWLWKLYIISGPAVRVLIWLFVVLFGLSQVMSFVFGSRFIFRATRKWIERILFFVVLLGCEAYFSLMAALGMNFVGQ
jgi:hypothetical protein